MNNTKVYKLALLGSIIVVIGLSYYTYLNYKNYQKDDDLVNHSERVKQTIQDIGSSVQDARMAAIGVIATEDTTLIPIYKKYSNNLLFQLKALDSLVGKNPIQKTNLSELKVWIDQYSYLADSLLNNRSMSGIDKVRVTRLISHRATLSDSIRLHLRKMQYDENMYLTSKKREREDSKAFAPITILFYTLVAAVIIGLLFNRIFDLLRKSKTFSNELQEKLGILNIEISKRQKVEKALLGVLNSSPNGILEFICIRDENDELIDFEYTMVNKQAEKMLGKKESDLIGKRLLEEYPGLKGSNIFQLYKSVVENKNQKSVTELYTADGFDNYFHNTAIYYPDGIVVTFTDVTEDKIQELELFTLTEELKRSNEELERFAYVASHDLQEPLRKVRAFGDRLLSKFGEQLPDPGPDYINRMQRAAARMQVLIDDLLQFSRVSRKQKDFLPVELNEVLEDIKEDLEAVIIEKHVVIEADKLPLVYGDNTQLRQLLQNLISNSIKFAKEGIAPKITISAKKIKASSVGLNNEMSESCWELKFVDNGIGFDSKYKDQIFTIFQRLHGREAYKGTGIGLAICDKIVQNHYGKIEADSELNEGSTFTVYLPTNKYLTI